SACALTSLSALARLIGNALPGKTGGDHGTGACGVAISGGRSMGCANAGGATASILATMSVDATALLSRLRTMNNSTWPALTIPTIARNPPTFPTMRIVLDIG